MFSRIPDQVKSFGKTPIGNWNHIENYWRRKPQSFSPRTLLLRPLHMLFNNVRHEEQTIIPAMALLIAQKSLKDTMDPNGLVSALLLCGLFPRWTAVQSYLPDQTERMRALRPSRDGVNRWKFRISQALRSKITASANYMFNTGDRVKVYWERKRKMHSPKTVFFFENQKVFIDGRRILVQHKLS